MTQKLQNVSKRDETNFEPIIKKKQYKIWAQIKYSIFTYTNFMSCHSVLSTVSQLRLSRRILRGGGATTPAFSFCFLYSFFFFSFLFLLGIFFKFFCVFILGSVWIENYSIQRNWLHNHIYILLYSCQIWRSYLEQFFKSPADKTTLIKTTKSTN